MILTDNQYLTKATSLVQNAKRIIQISTFKAEYPTSTRGRRVREFFEILIEKKSQGIQIEFLMNWNSQTRNIPRSNQVTMVKLTNNGIIPKILATDRCCHAKMLIVDHSAALIGSHNLSIASLTQNFETSCYLTRPEDVSVAVAVYNAIYEQAKTPITHKGWKTALPHVLSNPKKIIQTALVNIDGEQIS